MKVVFAFLFSYLMGTISGSFLIGKYIYKVDIRNEGSGNAGTTNAIRVFGVKTGLYTFLIDFIKGSLTVFLVREVFGPEVQYLALLACVLGHDFPFYMDFKGGKGVATSIGGSLIIAPVPTLILMGIWILGVASYRMVSLWSILLYLLLPLDHYLFGLAKGRDLILLILISVLGLYRHKENIRRILRGEEKKLEGGKK